MMLRLRFVQSVESRDDDMKARRLLSFLLIGIVMIGATSCMNNSNKAETMRDLASKYLQKYDDVFTPKGFSSSNWAYEYSVITFEASKYPGSVVEVRAYKNDDGSYRFKDNYFKFYMLDDAKKCISNELAKDTMSEIKIRFPSSIWSDEIEGCNSFEDWVSTGDCRLDIFIISQESISESDQEQIVNDIKEKKISGTITFITTPDKNNLIDYSLDDVLNNQKELVSSKKEYRINKD